MDLILNLFCDNQLAIASNTISHHILQSPACGVTQMSPCHAAAAPVTGQLYGREDRDPMPSPAGTVTQGKDAGGRLSDSWDKCIQGAG